MFSDFQSWITILSLLVALASLSATIYIYRKSEPTRTIGRIQVNKELARARLVTIADKLRAWEKEMRVAELKNERFDLSRSEAPYGGIQGVAIGVLATIFAEACSAYPHIVTRDFFNIILKDVEVKNEIIVKTGTFFDSRQNMLRAIREIDQIIATL